MLKRAAFVIALVVLFAAASGTTLLAQTPPEPQPDDAVRGSGAIAAHVTNAGLFDINVARFGTNLTGGFRYMEVTPQGLRTDVIYSQVVTGLQIDGNTATIIAVGYWRGMLSDLTVYVEDNGAAGSNRADFFHIIARPRSPLTIIYDQGGPLIKGDIVVIGGPPVPDAFAKGFGTIAVGRNVGRFSFEAARTGNVVKGNVYYIEYNPVITSPTVRPRIRIYLPAVETLDVFGNTAVLEGKGTLNGRPARVEVEATDNSKLAIPLPDVFRIKATPLTTDSVSAGYEAGGPLTRGDIVVETQPTP